jgi:hypothetical protein
LALADLIRLKIFLFVFWSLPMINYRLLAVSLISTGKFSENISSILVTNPRATKLLMIIESSLVYPMARMSTVSVTNGDIICMEQRRMLINLPLLPPLAVLTNLRYLRMQRACLTSP